MTKENPNPNSLAALRAKYALLDGDAPENIVPSTKASRKQFVQFASDALLLWQKLPQAELILEENTQSRIRRQQFFRKLPRP